MRAKPFASSLLGIVFLVSSVHSQVSQMSGFGDPNVGGRDTAMLETLLRYAPQQLPGWQINFKSAHYVFSNFSSLIDGEAEIAGISTVKYRATYLSTDTLGSFQVIFPLDSRIKPSSMNSLAKGGNNWTSFYLPPFLRNGVLLDSLDFRFPESGLSSSRSYYLGFKVLEDWQIFDQIDMKLSKIALGFYVGPAAEGENTKLTGMQGYLSAYLKWKDITELSVSSNLVPDIYDWVITIDARTLRLSDIVRSFKVDELTGMPLPSGIFDLSLEKATLDIRPVKGIELMAMTSLGNLNLVIERKTPENRPVSTEDTKQKDYKNRAKKNTAFQKDEDENGMASSKDPVNGGAVVSRPPGDTTWVVNPLYQPPDKNNGSTTSGPNTNNNSPTGNNTNGSSATNTKTPPATEAKGSKWGFMIGISLPENFRIGDKVPELQFLNNLQLYNAAIYLSSFAAAPQNSLPVHRNLGSGNPVLTKGINLLYGFDLEKVNISKKIGSLGDLTGINFVCFTANISTTPTEITLSGGINFNENVNIAGRIYFPYMEFQLKPFSSNPEVDLLLYTDLKLNRKNTLNFRAKAGLTALGTVKMAGAMVNEWVDPFGFKGFRVGGLMFQAGVDFSTTPIPTPGDFLMTGHAYMGDIGGKVILGFDFNEINKNLLLVNVDKLSWNNIITTFCGDNIKKYIPPFAQPFLSSELESARFKFVPPGAGNYTLSNEVFTPGFGVGASGNIAGWKGKFDIALEGFDNGLSAGLKATGEMDEIRVPPVNGFEVFRISGAGNSGKPKFIVDLTTEKFLKLATGNRSAADTLVYANASVTILGINNANAFINLNPQGYYCKLNGKIFGMLEAQVEAQIKDFANPLDNTYIKVNGVTAGILRDAQRYLSKAVFDLKFSIDSISFQGKLDGMKTGATALVAYRLAGQRKSLKINLTIGGAIDIAKLIFDEVEKIGQLAIAEIKKIADAAIAGLKNAAESALSFAKNTTEQALKTTNELKGKLTAVAQTTFSSVKDAFTNMGQKTQAFFVDFGKFSRKTVEMIYNKSIDQIKNGWSSFTSAMKKAFTGADNEERIMTDGPAFRVITKYQNQVLAATLNVGSNWPVVLRSRNSNNIFLESWQLVPNDKEEEGSFFLVSGYNALLITKAWTTHTILIPHESDHKNRERMMMEAVPNEPGWYYLKYRDVDNNMYTYVEVKNVQLPDVKNKPGFQANIPQMVLAPVNYPLNAHPGDMGKFKFEKMGDIDWINAKNLPPPMAPATPLVEGNRYNFKAQPEQYIYTNGTFRWIPDYETLVAGKFDARPLTELPNNQQVSTVLGAPYPSRKNGAVLQAVNDPAIYIMDNGMRRWIPDINTFNLMGLNGTMINSISKADLDAIPTGDQIPVNFNPKIVLQEKVLYQVPGDPTVYIVLDKTLRGIPDPETLGLMGYNFGQVQLISAQDLASIPKGIVLATRRQNALLQVSGQPEVYIMDNGIRRVIPDAETFNIMKLDWGKIQKVSLADMLLIPAGPAMISFK